MTSATPKGQKEKRKKKRLGFGLGVVKQTPGPDTPNDQKETKKKLPWGWFGHP
jgi:hypothetical protein